MPLRAHYSTSSRSGDSSWLARMRAQVDALAERTGTNKSSLLVSFLVLHELTAGIPWVVLFYAFTYFGAGVYVLQLLVPADTWACLSSPSAEKAGWVTSWVEEAVARARKRGKYGYRAEMVEGQVDQEAVEYNDALPREEIMAGALADAVAAYLVVKMLLPVRIALSLAWAPAVARGIVGPVRRWRSAARAAKADARGDK